ncbi:MAG: hypothetical protein ACI9C1_000621 [Candidatus Aldehydirespiratoraceae bacterium]|jgi:hypothetical protein
MKRYFTSPIWCLFVALGLLASACGSDANTETAVASLADTESDEDVDTDGADALTSDEAALAFSECLRGEGIDIPDVGIDADGNIDIRGSFQEADIDVRGEEFTAAREICFPLLDGVAFGGGQRAGLVDNPEIEDALLAFSDCIRAEGFDVGDAELPQPGAGAGGGTPPADGDAPARGAGQGQGGFGDPSARFAGLLGLDAEDPEVAAALEVCGPLVTDAFAGFTPGQR